MGIAIHNQVLLSVFIIAAVMGAVANKTNFCTMGAVSDWVNMGDTGRLRAWLFAMAVAIAGVALLDASAIAKIGTATFPPYRTPNFAWLRYLLGGLMFGIGMTLASGCGNKTLVRIGGGNIKSLVVLVIASLCAYLMLWTDFYGAVFNSWISATTIDLAKAGFQSQSLGDLLGGGATTPRIVAAAVALALLGFALASSEFRGNFDNVLGGLVVGAAVIAGWYLTAGPMGASWKEWAEMADTVPSRVEVQSFTFISPMGDSVRYLMEPTQLANVNFGIMALSGVIVGSFVYAVFSASFRVEWFASAGDFANHAVGAVLMGIGGVLSMGCTIGQAVTGVSTLALGSILTFVAIVAGAAATMKIQYWRMMREA
jgi:uncharacterized membrane protein YedE/YeeE